MAARACRLFRIPRVIAAVLALGACCVPSLAAADAPAHPCTQVRNDAARLRCYDDAFEKPSQEVRPARVTAVEYRAQGRFVATLDTGEAWVQSETNSKVRLAVGDVVTVRPAALGSYLLTGSQGIATRVRRAP